MQCLLYMPESQDNAPFPTENAKRNSSAPDQTQVSSEEAGESKAEADRQNMQTHGRDKNCQDPPPLRKQPAKTFNTACLYPQCKLATCMLLTQTLTLVIYTAPSSPAASLTVRICDQLPHERGMARQMKREGKAFKSLLLAIVPYLTRELGCDSSPEIR